MLPFFSAGVGAGGSSLPGAVPGAVPRAVAEGCCGTSRAGAALGPVARRAAVWSMLLWLLECKEDGHSCFLCLH